MRTSIQRDSRRVIIVLGAGRSGTSLLMQVLVGLGLQTSSNLVPANASNPEGFFEDAAIIEIQESLYDCLNTPRYFPLSASWLDTECAKAAKKKLIQVLATCLEKHEGIFGVKDPRIATFLPLWTLVFHPLRVVPNFILAVRNPSSVIASFIRHYNNPAHIAELIWLLRTIEALENTAADCFVVHFEDWFSDPQPLVQGLLHYTGLNPDSHDNVAEILSGMVKPSLNRASMDDYKVHNPCVLKLYAALKECHGADFDRHRLMSVVKECRQVMEGFKGWHQQAHQANKKLAELQTRLNEMSVKTERIKELECRIKALEKETLQGRHLAAQVQKLQRQLDQLLTI